jgi:hypothetical protein
VVVLDEWDGVFCSLFLLTKPLPIRKPKFLHVAWPKAFGVVLKLTYLGFFLLFINERVWQASNFFLHSIHLSNVSSTSIYINFITSRTTIACWCLRVRESIIRCGCSIILGLLSWTSNAMWLVFKLSKPFWSSSFSPSSFLQASLARKIP